jgi:hypothetical protein
VSLVQQLNYNAVPVHGKTVRKCRLPKTWKNYIDFLFCHCLEPQYCITDGEFCLVSFHWLISYHDMILVSYLSAEVYPATCMHYAERLPVAACNYK